MSNHKPKFYSLAQNGEEANLSIYGDITSWPWEELGEVSAVNLSRQLEQLEGVSRINVYINSYGGEVAEGLAIYNSLKRHPAQVVTHCDGFACSIASVIFMAGDVRVMNEASLLMIHNAWTEAAGNAAELRKVAKDLETITSASVAAYLSKVNITEEKLRSLMDKETWLSPAKALEYGFATEVKAEEVANVSQNARRLVQRMLLSPRMEAEPEAKVVCVTGAPCSGKTTYVEEHMGDNDVVFDYDTLVQSITRNGLYETPTAAQRRMALKLREAFVGFAREAGVGTAFVIATNPSEELREALGDCEYVRMEATLEECLSRLEESARPNKESFAEAIREYFGAEGDEEEGEEPEPEEPETEEQPEDEEAEEVTEGKEEQESMQFAFFRALSRL